MRDAQPVLDKINYSIVGMTFDVTFSVKMSIKLMQKGTVNTQFSSAVVLKGDNFQGVFSDV